MLFWGSFPIIYADAPRKAADISMLLALLYLYIIYVDKTASLVTIANNILVNLANRN